IGAEPELERGGPEFFDLEALAEGLVRDLRADVVIAGARLFGEIEIERETAEAGERRRRVEHRLAAAVFDFDRHVLLRRHARRAIAGDLAHEALEVHGLARAIEAAIGLDEAADLGLAALAILGQAEVPDLDAVGPVAVDDREVAVLLDGGDHAL